MMDICKGKKSAKIKPFRELDVLYDNTIALPSIKDYNREINRAATMCVTFVVQPRFDSMFSDTWPRQELVPKTSDFPFQFFSEQESNLCYQRSFDIKGAQRPLFFKQPLRKPKPSSVLANLPDPFSGVEISSKRRLKMPVETVTKETQTDYRESETQTTPWAHDVVASQDAQLLNLHWFSFGKNVPIGMEELNRIERDRLKQAWDGILSRMRSVDLEQWETVTAALLKNETAAKEKEIDVIHDVRMKMATKYWMKIHSIKREDLLLRLRRFYLLFEENTADKLKYLKHQLCRSVRKLTMKHRKVNKKWKKRDILTELRDKASEIYIPQIRHGEDPARRSQVIDTDFQYLNKYKEFEILERRIMQPAKPPQGFDFDKASKPQKPSVCRRRSMSIADLSLENFSCEDKATQTRKNKKELTLLKRVDYTDTPEEGTHIESEWEFQKRMDVVILKTLIEGRAVQKQVELTLQNKKKMEEEIP